MVPRFIDWIWHIRGSVALAPGQTSDEAFDKLEPLFNQVGTTHERAGDTLRFKKKDSAAQDKMSVFDGGVLQVERGPGGGILRYHMISRALLACFLAPLLFLGFAQLAIFVNSYEAASAKAGAASEEKKKAEKEKAEVPMHPIDKFLGAPEPEKPEKDKADSEEEGAQEGKHSPTPAYVFAGIFAALYVGGRILEDRLIKRLFRKRLYEGMVATSHSPMMPTTD